MKLVDILARELKEWPEGVRWILSDCANGCYADMGVNCINLGIDCSEFDGNPTSAVFEAGWQAAVDALKAGPSAKTKVALEEARVIRGEKTVEWDGEGLPPVGLEVDLRHSEWAAGNWQRAEIRYASDNYLIVGGRFFQTEQHFYTKDIVFRPIRTPGQIAAEEIQKIRDEIKWQKPQLGPCPVEQMYLLGYRKFEIVDN